MIRPATHDDIPALVEIAERHHAKSHWNGIVDFDEASAAESIGRFIDADSVCALVAVKDKIVGFIAIIISPLYFNAGAFLAQELCWYSESPAEAFALVSEARRQASGCAGFMIGAQVDDSTVRLERAYARMGFQPFTRDYLKVF